MNTSSPPLRSSVFLHLIFIGANLLTVRAFSQGGTNEQLQVEGVPYTWTLSNQAINPVAGPGNTLTFTAGGGTDLHYPASGAYRRNNAPMALFTPAGDFEFSAKVVPRFEGQYDGGALMLYTDTLQWAKILLQLSGTQPLIGMSVVREGITDDAYYPAGDKRSLYFKISRAGNLYSFHTSANGKAWTVTRQFLYTSTAPVRVGFYAQSPVGKGSRVQFSEILFKSIRK